MHHLLAFRSLVALELILYISTSLHFLLLNYITYSHSLTANHVHSHSRQHERTFTAVCPWLAVGCNSSCGPSLSCMSWQCIPIHLWVCPTCTYPPVSSEVPPSKPSLPPSRLNRQPSSWRWYQCTKVHTVLADACWKWSRARKYTRFIADFCCGRSTAFSDHFLSFASILTHTKGNTWTKLELGACSILWWPPHIVQHLKGVPGFV